MAFSQFLGYHQQASASWLPAHNQSSQSAFAVVPRRAVDPNPTRSVDSRVPLEDWTRWTSDLFTKLTTHLIEPRAFCGSIETIQRSHLAISHIAASPSFVRRGRTEISSSVPDKLFLNIHLEGHGAVRDERGATLLNVGDCILVDPGRPYVLEFLTDFRQLCVQLPGWWLREALEKPVEEAVGRPMSLESTCGSVLRAALEAIISPPDDTERETHALVDMFADVVGHTFRHAIRRGDGSGQVGIADRTFMGRLRPFITKHHADCELTAAAAAEALGCSVRNVHKSCHAHGTTFGRLLIDARLAAAARRLAEPGNSDARISSIAYACGFNDTSHFGRVFRQRYGVPPSRFRPVD